ncbi:hypothetical protein C8Q77DRAFT_1152269 [Trametes polyzona]|nr:hypothetical protein C8Q77DRAFT_1152269 [Trametes polyzona]
MPKVLDHPLGAAPTRTTFRLHAQVISRLLLSFFACLFASSCILLVAAQDIVNGRVSTQGFAILDSPQPNSVLNAGSETDVSIDISAVTDPASGIDLLEVYLVSSQTQKNITVSSGAGLLAQEPGSTVKHIHFSVPTCLESGAYNLTIYEASRAKDVSFFATTPIIVEVRNNEAVSGTCDAPENQVQEQPQASSPPTPDALSQATSPSIVPDLTSPGSTSANTTQSANATATTSSNVTASATTSGSTQLTPAPQPTPTSSSEGNIITVTAGDGRITVDLTSLPGTIVIEPSGGAPPENTSSSSSSGFITIVKTVAPTATATLTEIISAPVTVTLEETFVSTVTAAGATSEFTVTQTIISTTELFATQISGGLLPINSATHMSLPSSLLLHWSLVSFAFLFVMYSAL